MQLLADLEVDASARPLWSLVATLDQRVVGHVMFSAVNVIFPGGALAGSILAPLAVQPAFQARGIGGQLVTAGLQRLAEAGVALVFVLGYPDYYARFGFVEAGARGFEAPHPIEPKNAGAWRVRVLDAPTVGAIRGQVRCADALADPKYWRE